MCGRWLAWRGGVRAGHRVREMPAGRVRRVGGAAGPAAVSRMHARASTGILLPDMRHSRKTMAHETVAVLDELVYGKKLTPEGAFSQRPDLRQELEGSYAGGFVFGRTARFFQELDEVVDPLDDAAAHLVDPPFVETDHQRGDRSVL